MKKLLIYFLLFIPAFAFAQKPDFIRTPNTGNTIVDWNLKAKTFVLPHGATVGLFGSQDSTGNVIFHIGGGDTSLNIRIAGLKWWSTNQFASAAAYVPYTGATNNLNLGSHTLTAQTLIGQLNYTHTAGYGITGSNFTNSGNQTWTADSLVALVSKSFFNTVIGTAALARINTKQPIGNYITGLTGDGIATGPGSVAFTLATVNSNTGSFGDASHVGGFTVNEKGLITAASSTSIQIAESQVTSLVSDLAGKQDALSGTGFVFFTGTTPSYIGSSGSGNVALVTSPTLVAPVLGVATATSIWFPTNTPPTTPASGSVFWAGADNRYSFKGPNGFNTTFTSSSITTNRLYTMPDASTTLVGTDNTATLTNKSISGSSNTLTNIGNSSLINSSTTINGTIISLGASGTITANTLNSLTFNNSGSGDASGTTFNGGTANTISYNTIGAAPATGGAYITALTGDVTASGSGSVAATLATVNSNTGSFGSSTSIPTFTVNGKGLITAVSGNAVIAPAGTLTGTALAGNVVTSSLTSAAGGAFGTNAYTSTAYVPNTRALINGYAIVGGHSLATDITLAVDSALVQTIANFKPLGSTYWLGKTATATNSTLWNNNAISIVGIATNDILQWNGSAWQNSINTYSTPLHRSGGNTSIDNALADGSTKGASTYTASDFDSSSGLISIDYTNGQAASVSNKGFLTATDWGRFDGKQSAITFGTGVQTALGVNIGSAGAPVLFNGDAGTPSSITLTNGTGLPLTTGVTGILPIANGGTNTSSAGITAINNISGRSYTGFTGTGNLVGSTSPTFTGTITAANITSSAGIRSNGGIGVGAAPSVAAPIFILQSVAGANSYGIYNGATFDNTATNIGSNYNSVLNIATGGSLGNAWNYVVTAGNYNSVVPATQKGFYVLSMPTATFTTAFESALNSGSGIWNLYMGGTAPSYHLGNFLLGSTTATAGAEKLQLTGGASISGTLLINGVLTSTATNAFISNVAASTSAKFINLSNTGVQGFFGIESSAGGVVLTGSSAYDISIGGNGGGNLNLGANNHVQVTLVKASGMLGIGYTADPASGSLFAVNGNSYFNGTGTFTGNLSASLPDYSSGAYKMALYNTDNARFEKIRFVNINATPNYFAPANYDNITMVNNAYNIITPATTIGAVTFTLPSSPADGDLVYIKFTRDVSGITWAGGTVQGTQTQALAGNIIILRYTTSGSLWY